MAKPRKKMVNREKECRKIAKEKAARLRYQTLRRRFILISTFVALCIMGIFGWWAYVTDVPGRIYSYTENQLFHATKQAGFEIHDMYLLGRRITPMEDVTAALSIKPGDPILAVSAGTLRDRLEQLPYVKQAIVERELPHTLHIHITEREPVAVWQHDGKLDLIDMDGRVIPSHAVRPIGKLPLVVGNDAPTHAPELLRFLVKEPELFSQVKAAVRVGERRWDVRLQKGITIKLPQEHPEVAWEQLARMQKEQNVLERAITAIDLRLGNRVYIKLSPAGVPETVTNKARET